MLIGDWDTRTSMGGAALASGADFVDGGAGADTISGGVRELTVTTTRGTIGFNTDTINGGDGADTIYGDFGTFTITGPGPVSSPASATP